MNEFLYFNVFDRWSDPLCWAVGGMSEIYPPVIITGTWSHPPAGSQTIQRTSFGIIWSWFWKGTGKKSKIYCEGACGHMALCNFRLRFEPSGLPPLKNQPENRQFFHENRRFIKVYRQATTEALHMHSLHCHRMEWDVATLSSYGQSDIRISS
jgi:hypothetical protein